MTGAIDSAFVPARSSTVYSVDIDGEAVLLDEHEQRLHHLNVTAALVWHCMDGTASVTELAVDISEELGLPYDDVLADTLRVVREFDAELLLDGSRR